MAGYWDFVKLNPGLFILTVVLAVCLILGVIVTLIWLLEKKNGVFSRLISERLIRIKSKHIELDFQPPAVPRAEPSTGGVSTEAPEPERPDVPQSDCRLVPTTKGELQDAKQRELLDALFAKDFAKFYQLSDDYVELLDDPEERDRVRAVRHTLAASGGCSFFQSKLNEDLEKNPNNRWLSLTRAELAYGQSDWPGTLRILDSISLEGVPARLRTGVLELRLETLEKSKDSPALISSASDALQAQWLEQSARIKVQWRMAEALEQQKRILECFALREAVLDLVPNDHEKRFHIAYQYDHHGMRDMAARHYRIYLATRDSAAVWNNLGVSLHSLSLPILGTNGYQKALDGGETLAGSNLAQLLLGKGFLPQAIDVLTKCLASADVHENVHRTMASIKAAENEEGDKVKTIEEKADGFRNLLRLLADSIVGAIAPADVSGREYRLGRAAVSFLRSDRGNVVALINYRDIMLGLTLGMEGPPRTKNVEGVLIGRCFVYSGPSLDHNFSGQTSGLAVFSPDLSRLDVYELPRPDSSEIAILSAESVDGSGKSLGHQA